MRELREPSCDRLGRPGSDLLSHALRHSTIGPGGLNDRVRDGIGWGPPGIATRSTKPTRQQSKSSMTILFEIEAIAFQPAPE